MIHISNLSKQFVRFNPANESLSAGATVYRVGTVLQVQVATVDFNLRRADFMLVSGAEKDAGPQTPHAKREHAGRRLAESAGQVRHNKHTPNRIAASAKALPSTFSSRKHAAPKKKVSTTADRRIRESREIRAPGSLRARK